MIFISRRIFAEEEEAKPQGLVVFQRPQEMQGKEEGGAAAKKKGEGGGDICSTMAHIGKHRVAKSGRSLVLLYVKVRGPHKHLFVIRNKFMTDFHQYKFVF
jgi:hypothetical protein